MMLPILRILPVAGVLLAIALLALALSPLDRPRAQLRPNMASVRGAMIERSEHPEWRQFLILSAIQRADELSRLRELPDTPAVIESAPVAPVTSASLAAPAEPVKPAAPAEAAPAAATSSAAPAEPAKAAETKLVALPSDRSEADPDAGDRSVSIAEPPPATIPIDIGEASSAELPVAAPEEKPPVERTPERFKSRNESRIRAARHARHTLSPPNAQQSASFNIFELLFNPQPNPQSLAARARRR